MRQTFALFVLSLAWVGAQDRRDPRTASATKPESTESIIQKLHKNPADSASWIGELEKRWSEPQVVPALRELFVEAKLSGAKLHVTASNDIPVSQLIALTLMRHGIKDDIYFDEVAHYAQEAINTNPPDPYLRDTEGKEDTGKRNPAFEEWCALRALEFDKCVSRCVGYPLDLAYLGQTGDSRAIPILRAGLEASSATLVWAATGALSALNDRGSLPLIARSAARFSAPEAKLIALAAIDFDDPVVLSLLDRFFKDPEEVASVKKEWHEKHDKQGAKPGAKPEERN